MKYNINYSLHGGSGNIDQVENNNLLTDDKNKQELINFINEQKYDCASHICDESQWVSNKSIENSYQIPLDLDWKKKQLLNKTLNFELEGYKQEVKFNLYHLRGTNNENSRPLFILPGFSSDSFGWSLTRISKYNQEIFNQGFSDIYLFDFTGIGGRKKDDPTRGKNDLQKEVLKFKENIPNIVDQAYKQISKHIKENILSEFNNLSLLGRSAGGGLALQIVLVHGLIPKGLNVAAPGINFGELENSIKEFQNKQIPIRLCSTTKDKKVKIDAVDGSNNLSKAFFDNNYSDFIYFVRSTTSDADEINHRVQEVLIKNLV